MKPWLTIMGVGDDGPEGLAPGPRALLNGADIIVSSQRILESSDFDDTETHAWTSPIEDMLAQIESWRGRNVIVLATGDPMHYGVGASLARHIPPKEIFIKIGRAHV